MKFIYQGGDYATKDGVTFMFGNPTTVENKATIERLLKDPAFRKYEPTEEIASMFTEPPKGKACTKCGRIIRQGWFMHDRHCKGIP